MSIGKGIAIVGIWAAVAVIAFSPAAWSIIAVSFFAMTATMVVSIS